MGATWAPSSHSGHHGPLVQTLLIHHPVVFRLPWYSSAGGLTLSHTEGTLQPLRGLLQFPAVELHPATMGLGQPVVAGSHHCTDICSK